MSTLTLDANGTLAEMDLIECSICNKPIIDAFSSDSLHVNVMYETCWSGVYVCEDDDCLRQVITDNATEIAVDIV